MKKLLEKKMKKILLIEKVNIFTFILTLILSFRFEKVVLFDSHQILNNFISHNLFFKKKLEIILKKKLFIISGGINDNLTFFSNKFGLNYVNQKNKFQFPSFLKNKLNSDLDKVFKKHVLNYVQSKCRLYFLYRYLNKKFKCSLIENYYDYFNLKEKFKINSNSFRIIFFIESLNYFANYNLRLSLFLLKSIFINKFHLIDSPLRFDYGYQLSNRGVNEKIIIENLLKIKDAKIIFIKSIWNLTKKYYKKSDNLETIELKNFTINLHFFLKKIISTIFLFYLYFLKTNQFTNFLVSKIIIDFFYLEIFCQHYQIKNFISRDDYWESHGLRTIVQNKYKLNHIGLQHSAFIKPYGNSYICFDFFDYYFRYNQFNYDLYKQYSFSKKNIIIGNFTYENIIKSETAKCRKVYSNQFSNKKNILIVPPLFYGNKFIVYKEFFNKLKFIHKIFKNYQNINIFISIRKNFLKNKQILFKNYHELKKYKNRIFFNNDLSTQDIIIISDIIVVNDTSTIPLEILTYSKEKIICLVNFRFTKKKAIPWFEIDKNFIKQTSSEVFNCIKESIDNPNNLLKKQKSFYSYDLSLKKKNITIDMFQILKNLK